jgi:hypothetical protein
MVLITTSIALALLALSVPTASRKISIKNSCSATIFPAYTGGGGAVTLKDGSQAPTGWSLPKGQTTDLTVPDLCKCSILIMME